MSPVTKEQKLETQLRKAIAERNEIDTDLKSLEARKTKATERIKELMTQIGRDDYRLNDEVGFQLQRPVSEIYHGDAIKGWLQEKAPKLVRKCFKKVETFDKEVFKDLVEKGLVPDADTLLADESYVELKPGTPRLMPMRAIKSSKEK